MGYRSYDSRNNLFVGYFAHGEGWHNNHHADPRAACTAIAPGSLTRYSGSFAYWPRWGWQRTS